MERPTGVPLHDYLMPGEINALADHGKDLPMTSTFNRRMELNGETVQFKFDSALDLALADCSRFSKTMTKECDSDLNRIFSLQNSLYSQSAYPVSKSRCLPYAGI
jgi:hypothetical protein